MTALSPIRKTVKFIAEMYNPDQYDPGLAIADEVFSRQYNIFQFSIAPHITDYENYWIAWGGWFDNPTLSRVQIFMNTYLTEVFSSNQLIAIENSFWVDLDNDLIYMNIYFHPWQYLAGKGGLFGNVLSTFATAPKDESNPSDIFYGPYRVRTVLDVPSINNEISNIIAGVNTYKSIQIKVDNSDGHYDDTGIIYYFNAPLVISKSTEDAQSLDEFNQIFFGIVTDIKIGMNDMVVEAVDQFYEMRREFCNKFSVTDYPNIGDDVINEDIPVAWGPVYGVEPIEVDKDTVNDPPEWIDYIAIDPDFIESVEEVYDNDGNTLTHNFNASTGIIRVTELDGDGEVIEAAYMDVTGKSNNRIGDIITDALEIGEDIDYESTFWDMTETDSYIALSARIGFYFDGGTTRDLIEQVLKNDNAFLIQKNDGKLTLRQWGQNYDTWEIDSWIITQKPEKNFKDATKFYCSSVKVNYNKNHFLDKFENNYVDDSMELVNLELFKKSFLAEFETCLIYEADAIDLSARLVERFANMRETIKIGLGVDTFQINPLDKIALTIHINGREFTQYENFIVKSVNPGQDTLTLEATEAEVS